MTSVSVTHLLFSLLTRHFSETSVLEYLQRCETCFLMQVKELAMFEGYPEFPLAKEVECTLKEYPWLRNGVVGKSLRVKVDHCLSAGVELCSLRYSAQILLVVCILNLGKCAAIYYTVYLHNRSDTNPREKASLVTAGDAAASFLAEEDLTTEHLSCASREEFTGKEWPTKRSPRLHPGPSRYAIPWFRAASSTRWLVTLALCVAVSVVAAVLLAQGIDAQRNRAIAVTIRSLTAHGLGTTQPYATALGTLARHMSPLAGFYVATLFANMWQCTVPPVQRPINQHAGCG